MKPTKAVGRHMQHLWTLEGFQTQLELSSNWARRVREVTTTDLNIFLIHTGSWNGTPKYNESPLYTLHMVSSQTRNWYIKLLKFDLIYRPGFVLTIVKGYTCINQFFFLPGDKQISHVALQMYSRSRTLPSKLNHSFAWCLSLNQG